MFGLGHAPELILVLVIALIVLGPGKIPEVAQFLGKGIRELRQASADLQKTFDVNELVNPPAPPVPPPSEPPVAQPSEPVFASSESIAPPALVETAAKPKRTRKRAPARDSGLSTHQATLDTVETAVASPGDNGDAPAKPRARRRTSQQATKPVSLDAAV
jgi:sec-independent protein translocase protein TatA